MTILGIDISHHNGKWSPTLGCFALFVGDARFVLAKATEGSTFVDHAYSRFREQATSVRWGAYHVFRESSPVSQAKHFIRHAELRPGDVAALDLETKWAKVLVSHNGTEDTRLRLLTWLMLVQELGCEPLLYVSIRGLRVLTDRWREPLGEVLSSFPLWLCQYVTLHQYRPKRVQKGPSVPPTHKTWTVWQYTSSGPGPAYGFESSRVDLNLLNGGLEAWDRIALQRFQAKASGR